MRNVKINGKLCKLKIIDEKEKDLLIEKDSKPLATRRSTRIRKNSETEKKNDPDNTLKSPKKTTPSNKNDSSKKVTAGTKRKTLENSDALENPQSSKKIANDINKSNNNENKDNIEKTTNKNKRKSPEDIESTNIVNKRKAVEENNSNDNLMETQTISENEISNDTTKQAKTKSKSKNDSGKIIKFFFIKRIVMNQVVTIYSILEEYGNILSFEYIKNKKFEGLWYVN